jgi:hypothetical protein
MTIEQQQYTDGQTHHGGDYEHSENRNAQLARCRLLC